MNYVKHIEIKNLLSFVIPCYRSEKTIRKVYEEIIATVSQRPEYNYEIIAINDCSPDNVLTVLKEIAASDPQFKVVDFAKNFGKHSAVWQVLPVFTENLWLAWMMTTSVRFTNCGNWWTLW